MKGEKVNILNECVDGMDIFDATGFEDALREQGGLFYESQDGSRRHAAAGAYMSLLDYEVALEILDTYPEDKVKWLEHHYDSKGYLSPGFSVLAGVCRINLGGRK